MNKKDFIEMINRPPSIWDDSLKNLFVTCYDVGYQQGKQDQVKEQWRIELERYNSISGRKFDA